ncbi:MAG: ABC transporter ATP-binding protein [Planctomycetes bacterium]|nr:ABC transporter ATP-binding protein [Planctomycetota bacterium]
MIKPGWAFHRWAEICAAMLPFARRHRGRLLLGGLMSLVVIGIRLTLPWLFMGMLKPLLTGRGEPSGFARWPSAGAFGEPLFFGAIFLLLLVALGFSDFSMRLKFAQFAIGTVRDLRARAFQSALQLDPRISASGPGDLVARLIGDTARVKEGLKGFLVHVATNGAMLAGVSLVLLWVDPALGAIFAAAFALIALVTVYGTTRVYRRALKFRTREGLLAESIHQAWRTETIDAAFDAVNRSSGRHEATVTRLQGRTTWAAHAIFGASILLLVWLGMRSVLAGTLASEDMLVFILYALMARAPVVQLARQGTRTGKILACAGRLEHVLGAGREQESKAPLPALQRELRIADAKVYRPASQGGGRRLFVGQLCLRAGSRVAVVGASGSGKSTLLQVLSGALPLKRGEVWWDDVALVDVSKRQRQARIALLSQEPRWIKQPLWRLLGLADATPDATLGSEVEAVLKCCGARALTRRLGQGLESVVTSERLAAGERRALLLARAMLTRAALILLDDPFVGLGRNTAKQRLRKLLARRKGATVVVATERLPYPKLFDHIIELEEGRIVFDGVPAAYIARGTAGNAVSAVVHVNGENGKVSEP